MAEMRRLFAEFRDGRAEMEERLQARLGQLESTLDDIAQQICGSSGVGGSSSTNVERKLENLSLQVATVSHRLQEVFLDGIDGDDGNSHLRPSVVSPSSNKSKADKRKSKAAPKAIQRRP